MLFTSLWVAFWIKSSRTQDGRFVAVKFSSKEINICKPNIVIVFSNDKPDVKKLAIDRWKIFKIKDDDLVHASPKSK